MVRTLKRNGSTALVAEYVTMKEKKQSTSVALVSYILRTLLLRELA